MLLGAAYWNPEAGNETCLNRHKLQMSPEGRGTRVDLLCLVSPMRVSRRSMKSGIMPECSDVVPFWSVVCFRIVVIMFYGASRLCIRINYTFPEWFRGGCLLGAGYARFLLDVHPVQECSVQDLGETNRATHQWEDSLKLFRLLRYGARFHGSSLRFPNRSGVRFDPQEFSSARKISSNHLPCRFKWLKSRSIHIL